MASRNRFGCSARWAWDSTRRPARTSWLSVQKLATTVTKVGSPASSRAISSAFLCHAVPGLCLAGVLAGARSTRFAAMFMGRKKWQYYTPVCCSPGTVCSEFVRNCRWDRSGKFSYKPQEIPPKQEARTHMLRLCCHAKRGGQPQANPTAADHTGSVYWVAPRPEVIDFRYARTASASARVM